MVSPPHTNVQVVNTRSHVQSRKLFHLSGTHCHMRAPSTSGCVFVSLIVQQCTDYSSSGSLFQGQDVVTEIAACPSMKLKDACSLEEKL